MQSNIWSLKEFLLEHNMLKTLEDLILMVRERKTKPQSESYTNKLLANKELSVEKVKEEVKESSIKDYKKNLEKMTELLASKYLNIL